MGMRMSFSGLEIALSGLYTSQKALNVANHNIANASTPGYSRQVGEISTTRPYTVWDGSGMVGTGSQMTAVNRIRDNFLDYRYWNESSGEGEWNVKNTSLEDLQAVFNEPSDSGFAEVMNEFYGALQEVSKDPSSLPARDSFKEKAVTLSRYFNNMSGHLQKLQKDYNFNVKSKVDEINSYAVQIRNLNEQIYKAELDGNQANDLRDKRQLIVDSLSKLVNIDAKEEVVGTLGTGIQDKRFSISINGHVLVSHYDQYNIQYIQRTAAQKQNAEDVDGLYSLQWEDGNAFKTSAGELKAYLDVRDGNGNITTGSKNPYKGIPYYIGRLDKFVRTFAESMNKGLGTNPGSEVGFGLEGSTGIKIFTANNANSSAFTAYSTLTAANMGVSGDILAADGVKKIPASDVKGQSGNNKIIESIINQRHDLNMFSEGTPEDFMKSLVATLGVDADEAIKMSKSQEAISKQIATKRESVSGVNIDEEMTNVVKYQQIYSASAKLISIMDSLYEITVNRLGAGR